MTDVLIIKRIPGHRRGEIVPRSERLEQHIRAGNAKILPNEHDAWNGEPQAEVSAPQVSQVIGNVSHDAPADHEHVPEPTDDLEGGQD